MKLLEVHTAKNQCKKKKPPRSAIKRRNNKKDSDEESINYSERDRKIAEEMRRTNAMPTKRKRDSDEDEELHQAILESLKHK